ncbi:MAG: hypothetical protein DRH26_03365 [Deltaproteobacteria bacterium]|nr:MAG: hypothetical protein DRH26_03365 [Deltaproteobacteria bacterium]
MGLPYKRSCQGYFLQTIDHFIGKDAHLSGACLTKRFLISMPFILVDSNNPDMLLLLILRNGF